MGGVFINYRRSPRATDAVHRLRERLRRHFGDTQVFLDTSSMLPGNRYPDDLRDRVHDCEVLLVTIPEGWLEARNQSGERCLDRAGDWVRHEIELALAAGKTVIPLLLDAAEPPSPELLPASIRDLSLRQAHRVTADGWDAAVEELIATLETLVAPEWEPIPSEDQPPRRPGQLLGWATGLLATALCVLVPWAATAGGPPPEPGGASVVLLLALASLGLMGIVLVAVLVSGGLMRRPIQAWERDLQDATQQNYLRATFPVPVFLLLFATLLVIQAWGRSPGFAVVLMLGMCLAVGPMAAHFVRSFKKDRERWVQWPEAIPPTALMAVVRREIARLDMRTQEWSGPIRREQRDRARFALGELTGAVAAHGRAAERGRLPWLREAQPWVFSGYVLWLALTVALTLAWTLPLGVQGEGGTRLHAAPAVAGVVGFWLAWTTMECAYRYQRWQRRMFHTEAVRRLTLIEVRIDTLSLPSRTRLATT
ncbi:TIR domain-containing protein [Streptomyces sp. SID4919]|uniref:TIR domain-containing protein n=1 Tax=unclassified Streptomyces TaxID=2593676 RepID=UPI000823A358|nr:MULTISPECIES: TIR domain-containing protein [unclassified Streptomyces]MYY11783.1 TIR domain-containing protein [Streptomyces sp. SID4919]SCK11735.1 TIR domain-containing protein [Streptomyces sp. AmelKG-E11A]